MSQHMAVVLGVPPIRPQVQAEPSAEEIRRQHIGHEASIRSVGLLYYLGACLMLSVGLMTPFLDGEGPPAIQLATSVAILAIGLLQLCSAYGLRRLRSWARTPAIVLCAIGLLAFPVGTIINGYIMYLLASQKGGMVLSDHYRAVIEATPDVRSKTSVLAWIVLIVILLLVILGITAAITSG